MKDNNQETKKSLVYQTKANDVDEKGIVTVAVNGIGIEDSQHDISMPGSFDQTLKEDFSRLRWYLNHDVTQLLGVPLSGEEKGGNLIMVGQLNLAKQIGRDTLADYKLYAEAGRTLEHSIGVRAMERDGENRKMVKRWKMFEYSTLTSWGSNPQTFLVNIKSATQDRVREACDFIRQSFKQHGYSDERLKNYDMELNLLLKSLAGGTIVSCPHCGFQFDYDQAEQHTFSQEVLDAAARYTRWIADDTVYEQIQALKPEIQAAVIAILDTYKGDPKDFSIKSVEDFLNYVRCPHCYGRVYRSNNIIAEELPTENQDEPETQEPAAPLPEEAKADDFFKGLNNSFTIH